MENKKKNLDLKHSFSDNLGFMFGNMWRWNPKMTVLSLMRAPFMVAIPFLGLYLSRTVILLIEAGTGLNQIALSIVALCAATAACMVILNILNGQNRRMEFVNSFRYQKMILDYAMSHDYEYNESPKGLSDATKAMQNCGSDQSGSRKAIDTLSSFAGNVIGMLSYASIIFMLNPLILIIICVTTISSYFLLKRITAWNHKYKDNWLPIDRKLEYLEIVSKDFASVKDIRLYNMAGWLRSLFDGVLKQRMDWQRKEETYSFGIDMLCAVLSLIREGVAYGLLVYMIYTRNIPVADFVLYFGVIGGFTAWFDGIADNLYWFDRINVGFDEMREYFDHQNQSNQGDGIPLPEDTFSIEFQNVSYQFAESDKEIFRDFNLTIRKGEKLAIVGSNGAGKTTLVKLLCGLYRPVGGEILADGHPIDAYNIEEFHSMFSAVFQDITILPMTVRQNITCRPDSIDENRLQSASKLSGFDETSRKLSHGADTYLVRGLYPDATDLSGGETQKLALARALYKKGKFLILDEPTAALDPIAESRIYQQYNDISKGMTSVFISHRLASTRFCDRIVYLEDGKIIEDGTHDELIAKKGKYFELFEIQSHYYRTEAEVV